MEVGDIRFYKERWKAVEEIEQQELRAMPLEEHWRRLNAIVRFSIETGMKQDDDDGEMEVLYRWAVITQPAFREVAKTVCVGGVRPRRTPFLSYILHRPE